MARAPYPAGHPVPCRALRTMQGCYLGGEVILLIEHVDLIDAVEHLRSGQGTVLGHGFGFGFDFENIRGNFRQLVDSFPTPVVSSP